MLYNTHLYTAQLGHSTRITPDECANIEQAIKYFQHKQVWPLLAVPTMSACSPVAVLPLYSGSVGCFLVNGSNGAKCHKRLEDVDHLFPLYVQPHEPHETRILLLRECARAHTQNRTKLPPRSTSLRRKRNKIPLGLHQRRGKRSLSCIWVRQPHHWHPLSLGVAFLP